MGVRAVKSHLLRVRLPVFMVFSPSHLLFHPFVAELGASKKLSMLSSDFTF